jgi:hypothetical protein
MRDKYEAHFRKKALESHLSSGEGVKDFSGPIAPGAGRDAIDEAVKKGEVDRQGNALTPEAGGSLGAVGEKMGAQMASQSASQGNLTGTIGGGLMMTGNPYLMAGGLGLQVLAAGEQNKRNAEEAQRQAYNERIKQRQMQMHRIASMGIQ